MSLEELTTKERLARAIIECLGGKYDPRVERMIRLARSGYYDEFECEIAMPITQLINDLRAVGFDDMAQRAMEGEFDCTEAEGDAWMQREGWALLTGKHHNAD